MPAPAKKTLAAMRAVPRRSFNVGIRMTPTRANTTTARNSSTAYRPYTKRRGTEITAGQRAGVGLEDRLMRGVLLDRWAESCELVLFMLMVSASCEGHHASAAHPKPILPRSVN